MPANLASVFSHQSMLEKDLHTNLISPNEINYSEGNSDEETEPESGAKSPDLKKRIVVVKTGGPDEEDEEETPQSYVRNFGKQQQNQLGASQPNSILKTSRYFNYRSSLTNSVRGSLMECTVPEDGLAYDMNNLDSASINFRGSKRAHGPRGNAAGRGHGSAANGNYGNFYGSSGRSRQDTAASDGLFSLTFNPALMSTRRFVSTIDANGLLSMPVNLEAVEHNLRNSLIKRNADHYRRSSRKCPSSANATSLFPQYVSHVLGLNLFFNPLLILLNISFFFNIIGKSISTNLH